jgi:hypothetical protein
VTLELLVVVVAAFGVWMAGLADVLRPRETGTRTLRQDAWVPVVFFGFAPGAVCWYLLGRPGHAVAAGDDSIPAEAPAPDPETNRDREPETSEAFRERVRARAEDQRRRYAEQRQRALDEDTTP